MQLNVGDLVYQPKGGRLGEGKDGNKFPVGEVVDFSANGALVGVVYRERSSDHAHASVGWVLPEELTKLDPAEVERPEAPADPNAYMPVALYAG